MKNTKTDTKYYMLVWNIGGNLHDTIYKLTYRPKYDGWWDNTNNTGFDYDSEEAKHLETVCKKHDGYWVFITKSLETAKLVFLGAKTTKEFIKTLIK